MWIQKLAAGVQSIAYAPDGCTLYTVDNAGSVRAWDTAPHEKRRLFQLARGSPERYNVRAMYTADEGRFLVLQVVNYLRVWDVAGENLLPNSPEGLIHGT